MCGCCDVSGSCLCDLPEQDEDFDPTQLMREPIVYPYPIERIHMDIDRAVEPRPRRAMPLEEIERLRPIVGDALLDELSVLVDEPHDAHWGPTAYRQRWLAEDPYK